MGRIASDEGSGLAKDSDDSIVCLKEENSGLKVDTFGTLLLSSHFAVDAVDLLRTDTLDRGDFDKVKASVSESMQ